MLDNYNPFSDLPHRYKDKRIMLNLRFQIYQDDDGVYTINDLEDGPYKHYFVDFEDIAKTYFDCGRYWAKINLEENNE